MSEETLTSTFILLRRKFLRLASRFFPDEEDANDALQEAFCRLWPKRDEIGSRQEAEAMTVATVRNLGIDAYRRRQSVQWLELNEERDGGVAEPVSDELERREQFRTVETIIDRHLTEVQRTIVRRREYDGAEFSEIAAELGMEEPAVRMQLSRARKTIRMCYQKLSEK